MAIQVCKIVKSKFYKLVIFEIFFAGRISFAEKQGMSCFFYFTHSRYPFCP